MINSWYKSELAKLDLYDFCSKNGKVQKRGKINLVGRLQLSTEKSQEEDNEGIMQLRILRVQVSLNYKAQNIVCSGQLYMSL